MAQTPNETTYNHTLVVEWLAIRKEAGLTIDPETAEVMCDYAYTMDPYGVVPDLTDEIEQIGHVFFARSPGSDIWVHFSDLPDETLATLRGSKRMRRSLEAFEAAFAEMARLIEER